MNVSVDLGSLIMTPCTSCTACATPMKHLTAALASQAIGRGRMTCVTRSLSSNASTVPYPRAAVAVTVQSTTAKGSAGTEEGGTSHYYLLVQRSNPPDQGKWSLPGGKIQVGEPTLEAAQRELQEETGLVHCQWYPFPFLTTDAISYKEDHTNTALSSTTTPATATTAGEAHDKEEVVQFHYLIAQCFALASDGLPPTTPSDDALDAQWFTLSQMKDMRNEKKLSEFVVPVVERAETLSSKGLLI